MVLPDQTPTSRGWLREAGRRALVWWPAKMAGTTLGMTAFFVVYFWLLRNPLYPVTTMPLIAVDHWIGFQPWTLPLYLSLWFYVSLTPALVIDRRELVSYAIASVVLSVIGLGIFLFWPTAVPPPEIDWSQHPSVAFLKAADAAGNACPSLHVAFAVFSALWFARLLPQLGAGRVARWGNWLWCLGILYSTLATKQHVALDVLGGAALGALVGAVHLRWVRKGSRSGNL
jgi:membrane-associated phospholipid phosphatase